MNNRANLIDSTELNSTKDRIKLLSSVKLFANLTKKQIINLLPLCELVTLQKGDMLIQRGEESDALYIITKGHLLVDQPGNPLQNRLILIKTGEIVGEIGVLTGSPRAASVIAARDCELLKISRENFLQLCQDIPSIALETAVTTAGRLYKAINHIQHREKSVLDHKSILVISGNQTIALNSLIDYFHKQLTAGNFNFRILTQQDYLSMKNLQKTDAEIIEWLNTIENNHKLVFYFDDGTLNNEWHFICLQQADQAMVLVDGDQDHFKTSASVLSSLNDSTFAYIPKEIVFFYNKRAQPIENTREYLTLGQFFRHHHIFLNKPTDIQRLIRFITDQATGLVLSGGGFKGWAQLGAMKAIMENNIPIDSIAGVSCGAAFAAVYLQSNDYQQFYEHCSYLLGVAAKAFKLSSVTFPYTSIFNGKNTKNNLTDVFGETLIENARINYFAIATNLSKNSQAIINTGPLWKAVRASGSLPCLVPPVVDDGDLLVDGAIVNNLPTDVMIDSQKFNCKIIAVDISNIEFDPTKYDFPHALTWGQYLKRMLRFRTHQYTLPHYSDILMNSMMLGSINRTLRNRSLADVLIAPINKRYPRLDSKEAEELVELGYRTAMDVLSKSNL